MRVILGESRLPSLPLPLPLHPGEGSESCRPSVTTESGEELLEKAKGKKLFNRSPPFSSLSLSLSASVCSALSLRVPCCSVILRDASEGDHLLIHLSPALLPVPQPLSLSMIGARPFPLLTLFVTASSSIGLRPGLLLGGGRGRRWCPGFTQTEIISTGGHFLFLHPRRATYSHRPWSKLHFSAHLN